MNKECEPTKPSMAKRFMPADRASGLRLVALMLAIVLACVGAYFGLTERASLGHIQFEPIQVAYLALAAGVPCASALLCKKFLKRSIKAS